MHEGFAIVGPAARLGEAWYRGPVIVSCEVLQSSLHLGGGRNLVWHEFAHQLDMLDREIDGTPPLEDRAQYRRWIDVMTAEHERLRASAGSGEPTLLDHYGSVNEAEFFAVVTECFFDRPIEMRDQHPELYELFKTFYRQDTAARLARTCAGLVPAGRVSIEPIDPRSFARLAALPLAADFAQPFDADVELVAQPLEHFAPRRCFGRGNRAGDQIRPFALRSSRAGNPCAAVLRRRGSDSG